MKSLFFLFAAMLCAFTASAAPKYYSDGTVFYIVHKGGPLDLTIKLTKGSPEFRANPVLRTMPSALTAVYNPQEEEKALRYWRVKPGEKEQIYHFNFPDAAAGVWQIRNSFATNCNMSISFETKPAAKYGVLFSRCRILNEDLKNIANSYFYVPDVMPNLTQNPKWYASKVNQGNTLHLSVRGAQTEFFDKHGKLIAYDDIHMAVGAKPDFYGNSNRQLPQGATERQRETTGPSVRLSDDAGKNICDIDSDSAVKVPVQSGKIYRLNVRTSSKGAITLDGFPIILCPDAATAGTIAGSALKGADNRTYAHQFQRKMVDWMRSLTPQDLEVKIVPMAEYRKDFLADTANVDFLNIWSHLPLMLRAQNTDGKSSEFGAGKIRLTDFALIASLDRKFNRYLGNKGLINRTLLYYFRNMLPLSESGAMYDDPTQGAYCGGTEWTGWESMALYEDYMALAMLAPVAEPKLIQLWAEALKLQVHRMWSTRLTCENQSLHWPLKLYALAKGTGNPLYRRMADDYIADFANPELSESMKTGYPMEAYGLDGTYTGISTSMLAFGILFADAPAALAPLTRIYELMAHTVVREPDGSLSAANGFAHRTTGSWLNRQYDGGTPLVADKIEYAAVVNRAPKAVSEQELARQFDAAAKMPEPGDFDHWCRTGGEVMTRYSLNCWIGMWPRSYFKVGEPIADAKLPHEKEKRFSRDFNGEFFARKTPQYYLFLYTGNFSHRRTHYRDWAKSPFPELCRIESNRIHSAQPSRGWMPMQGINVYATPKFGAFILSRNWSLYSQNVVRAERDGKVVDYPTCYSLEYKKNKDKFSFERRGALLGVRYDRELLLDDSTLRVDIEVKGTEKSAPMTLIEQLPFYVKPGMTFEPLNKKTTRFRVALPSGAGIELTFDRPVIIRRGPDSSSINDAKLRTGLLEVVFAEKFTGGKAELSYTIQPSDKK